MTQNGIKITDLRAEVQTLVNSDPTKYDPNKNGKIDEGDELSQLLSEYQCKKEDLTSNDGGKMWTLNEQLEISNKTKSKNDELGLFLGLTGAITTGIGSWFAHDMFKLSDGKIYENKEIEKVVVGMEKRVADGTYNPKGRPAADIYSKSGRPFMIYHKGGTMIGQKRYNTLQELADSWRPTYDTAIGKGGLGVDLLRDWRPGDPQFVKEQKVVKDVKKVFTKGFKKGILGLGITALAGIGLFAAYKTSANDNIKQAQTEIKAKQTADGERIFEQRRKEEAELKARKEAMKQEELEYKERLNTATTGIEKNISSANRKAKSVNKELDKIKEKVTTEE